MTDSQSVESVSQRAIETTDAALVTGNESAELTGHDVVTIPVAVEDCQTVKSVSSSVLPGCRSESSDVQYVPPELDCRGICDAIEDKTDDEGFKGESLQVLSDCQLLHNLQNSASAVFQNEPDIVRDLQDCDCDKLLENVERQDNRPPPPTCQNCHDKSLNDDTASIDNCSLSFRDNLVIKNIDGIGDNDDNDDDDDDKNRHDEVGDRKQEQDKCCSHSQPFIDEKQNQDDIDRIENVVSAENSGNDDNLNLICSDRSRPDKHDDQNKKKNDESDERLEHAHRQNDNGCTDDDNGCTDDDNRCTDDNVTGQNIYDQAMDERNNLIPDQHVTSPVSCDENLTSQIMSCENVTSPIMSHENVTSQIISHENVTSQIITHENVTSQIMSRENVTTQIMSHDQLKAAYYDLLHKYTLLQHHRDEQLVTEQKMNSENELLSAELKKVTSERDRYQIRLNEFEDCNLSEADDVKQLELTIEQQKQEIVLQKETLITHEAVSKHAILSVQNELKSQLEKMKKICDESTRDKQSMVMKYAQAEQKNIELQEKLNKMDGWLKDWLRQRDNLMGRLNATAAEKQKQGQLLESRASEMVSLKREVERQKELVSSQEMKAKWHQSKLKVELESHKETKLKFEEVQQKLKESKEECEKIKLESQSVLKNYQMSQVMDCITKELQLKETEEELLSKKLEQTEQQELLLMMKQELDSLKSKEKELVEELNTYKDKVTCLESERVLQEEILAKFKDTIQTQKKMNHDISEEKAQLVSMKPEIVQLKQKLFESEKDIEELRQENKDLLSDMDGYSIQESEHLQFSQKLSDETVRLQSDNLALGDEISSLTSERETLKNSVASLSTKIKSLENEMQMILQTTQQKTKDLEKQLKEQTSLAQRNARELEDREDELKTIKRLHLSSSKDLKRQLSQLQKRLESYENRFTNGGTVLSTISRTSSSGSLDSGAGNSSLVSKELNHKSDPQVKTSAISSIADIDKEVFIDKIVRLQKSHARKNEKIEFMQDHIGQLLEEINKKSRIIQNYIMREESYALTPSEMVQQTKTLPAKKSGGMTSMFVSSETGRDLCEDLAEHNSRLQTVLEDKVIHNLTLKHTVETLGQEISHLSRENQKLQQELERLNNGS